MINEMNDFIQCGINRIIMEFKLSRSERRRHRKKELIES